MTSELRRLWELIGEIGCLAEISDDERLHELYTRLANALDYCTDTKLVDMENCELP